MIERPCNVRVVHDDGSTIPVELAYAGTNENGLHVWTATTAFAPLRGDVLRVERLPARSTIVFPDSDG